MTKKMFKDGKKQMSSSSKDMVKALEYALTTSNPNSIAVALDSITEALSGILGGMADETEEKETKINDKPTKPTKLMMEWPTALTALADDEESHADEAHSLQQLLASVFDGLWV
jgi:hypothetical protein